MKTPAILLSGVVAVFSIGCVTVTTTGNRDETIIRSAKSSDALVEVFEGSQPSRPFKVIGTVRARVKLSPQKNRVTSKSKIIAALKREARKLGGDCLTDLQVTSDAGGGTYINPQGGILSGSSEIWIAKVIVWLDSQ